MGCRIGDPPLDGVGFVVLQQLPQGTEHPFARRTGIEGPCGAEEVLILERREGVRVAQAVPVGQNVLLDGIGTLAVEKPALLQQLAQLLR